MNIKFDLIRRTFYISFFILLMIVLSLFISYPFNKIIIPALAFILVAMGIYQMVETGRIRKLLFRTSDILSRSTERDFPAIQDGEKNIINHKISDLIEQLEDSVKQTEQILKDKDRLEKKTVEQSQAIESMKLILNRDVLEIRDRMRESAESVDSILKDMSAVLESCNRESEMMNILLSHYASYSDNYDNIIDSIVKSRKICEREFQRSQSAKEILTELYVRNEESDEQLHTIIKGIDNIREVTDIINEVAEKASILSLNAAIESAHAGEAGKGFSVVAEEVGVLADKTAEHADFINEALYSVSDIANESKYNEYSGDDSFTDLIGSVRKMADSFIEIKGLLKSLSLIEKPEALAIKEENLKDKSILEKSSRALSSVKEEWEISLEKVSRLSLLKEQPLEEESKTDKFALHETAVKTVNEEDLSEQVE